MGKASNSVLLIAKNREFHALKNYINAFVCAFTMEKEEKQTSCFHIRDECWVTLKVGWIS